MPGPKPPSGESLYRGPSSAPRDKRERARDRDSIEPVGDTPRETSRDAVAEPRRDNPRNNPRNNPREHAPSAPVATRAASPGIPRTPQEQRWHGLNACLALFARRPASVRKVWLLESRIAALKPVLAHCVKQRLGYTVVEADDLERLSGSAHHEGVVFSAMAAPELSLADWLHALPPGPCAAVWLDGVGNPHNFGAILRSAAHFGVSGVLLPAESTLSLSGAAARVAEGGAEGMPLVRLGRDADAMAQLQAAGFTVAATVVRGGESLYSAQLPARLVVLMGAEQSGVGSALAQASTLRLMIPGSGTVESLNVASATSVLLSEWARQRQG